MAQVYVRGKSLWIHFSVDGTLYRKPLKLKNNKNNMRLALNKAFEIEELIENNKMPTDEDVQIKRIEKPQENKDGFTTILKYNFDMYLNSKTQQKKVYSAYKNAFNRFEKIIDTEIPIKSVSSFHYNTYKEYLLNETGVSYATAASHISYMHIYFNHLIESKFYDEKNPFIRLKKEDKKYIRIIPDNHFDMILKYLKDTKTELYRFILFLRYTGFRLNEAAQLKWEQIKFDENIISMTTFKDNNRNDLFPLNIENGKLKEFLLSFKKESGKLFNLNSEWIRQPFQKAIEKINTDKRKEDENWKDIPKYTIHDIRRTFCSKYASKLTPIELMKLARHKDITTTLKFYVNLDVNAIADKLNKG